MCTSHVVLFLILSNGLNMHFLSLIVMHILVLVITFDVMHILVLVITFDISYYVSCGR
jgi:hypothetical protein